MVNTMWGSSRREVKKTITRTRRDSLGPPRGGQRLELQDLHGLSEEDERAVFESPEVAVWQEDVQVQWHYILGGEHEEPDAVQLRSLEVT